MRGAAAWFECGNFTKEVTSAYIGNSCMVTVFIMCVCVCVCVCVCAASYPFRCLVVQVSRHANKEWMCQIPVGPVPPPPPPVVTMPYLSAHTLREEDCAESPLLLQTEVCIWGNFRILYSGDPSCAVKFGVTFRFTIYRENHGGGEVFYAGYLHVHLSFHRFLILITLMIMINQHHAASLLESHSDSWSLSNPSHWTNHVLFDFGSTKKRTGKKYNIQSTLVWKVHLL